MNDLQWSYFPSAALCINAHLLTRARNNKSQSLAGLVATALPLQARTQKEWKCQLSSDYGRRKR